MDVLHYLASDSNYKLFIAVTKESDKISTKSSSAKDIDEIKVEPDDFHDSMVDVSEQVENSYYCSELSQNVHKFGEKVSGSYNYRK